MMIGNVQAPVSAVAPAPPSSFFYYSFEAGPVHSIFLSPYSKPLQSLSFNGPAVNYQPCMTNSFDWSRELPFISLHSHLLFELGNRWFRQGMERTTGHTTGPELIFLISYLGTTGMHHAVTADCAWLVDAVDYTPGSDQWNWLAYDLLKLNRTKTPWITVNIHNPW